MNNVYDLQKKINVLSPVTGPQEIDFKNPNLNVSDLLKEAKKNNMSPEKEVKLSSRHRMSKTSLIPSMKSIVADEDEYYDEEYDEEEDGEENKIDEQAVEIMSPGKKIKALEKEEEKKLLEPSIEIEKEQIIE